MTDPPINLVTLGNVDVEQARFVSSLNAPDAGRALVRAMGDWHKGRQYALVGELLAAIGARDDVTGRSSDAKDDWISARAFYEALPIRQLVVADAQFLPPELLRHTLDFAKDVALELWLVAYEPLSPARNLVVERAGGRCVRRGRFYAAFAEAENNTPHQPRPPAPQLPFGTALPDEEFLSFRHTCARHLPAPVFEAVDQLLWQAATPAYELASNGEIGPDDALELLEELLDRCVTLPEMAVVIRGAQIGLFHHGYSLQADLPAILSRLEDFPTAASHNPATWLRLRAYKQPWRGAAHALYVTGVNVQDQLELLVDHVAADGGSVTDRGTTYQVEPGAQVYLRAQLAYRRLKGAGDGDRLFAWDRNRRFKASTLANALKVSAPEVGFTAASKLLATSNDDPRQLVTAGAVRLHRHADLTIDETLHREGPAGGGQDAAEDDPVEDGALARTHRYHRHFVLDHKYIRTRRQQQHLTITETANAAGVSPSTIRRLENVGGGADFTARQLERLADGLACDPGDLFRKRSPASDGSDVETVGALLHQDMRMLPTQTMAEILDWGLEQVEQALDGLDEALRATGARLHRGCRNDVAIRPAANRDTDRLRQLVRRHRARVSVPWTELKMLLELASNPDASFRAPPGRRRIARQALRNAGYLSDDEHPELTDTVRYSLYLPPQ